jgi:leucyl/phenylalanyl-tRNA--protein transferase
MTGPAYESTPPDADPQRPTPSLLMWAYRSGIFPMADPETGAIEWYDPDPRGILPLDAFHVPRTLARAVRRRPFRIVSDTAFEQVMRACAAPRLGEHDSWIDERLIEAYCGLHERGAAHTVEAWLGDALVGGLYGVHVGAAFFGESMFIRPDLGGTDASKICLVHLVAHLRRRGFMLLDTQFTNEHLDQFGCAEIRRDEYHRRLAAAVARPVAWEPFEAAVSG